MSVKSKSTVTVKQSGASEELGANSGAGQMAIAVGEITAAFPAIRKPIEVFERTLRGNKNQKPAQKTEMYAALGQRVGRRLAVQFRRIHDVETVEQALSDVIVGMFYPLIPFVSSGLSLRSSKNGFLRSATFSVNRVKERIGVKIPDRCTFMCHLLEGMLNHAEQLPNVAVSCTESRPRGAGAWVFNVDIV